MSDEGGGDQDAQASQGRWLGAVRSWVGSAPAQEDGAPAAASASPALSADEIRRRRLERMEGAQTQQVSIEKQPCLHHRLMLLSFCGRPLGIGCGQFFAWESSLCASGSIREGRCVREQAGTRCSFSVSS